MQIACGQSVPVRRRGELVAFEPMLPGRDTNLVLNPKSFKYAVADYDRDGHLDLYVVGIPKDSVESLRAVEAV